MITKYGQKAILRRDAGDRYCIACELEFSPAETVKMANPTARLFLLSPTGQGLNLAAPPNNELDRLVLLVPGAIPDQVLDTLKIIAPCGRLAPAGTVVYWELHCSR
jgi:hypothetical protein